jgi:hypothetical protein
MAGDWIKVEEHLPDKPEVVRMAAILGIDPDAVTGKLIRIWAWASRSCHADGVTDVTVMSHIDRVTNVTGFAESMKKAGWLEVDGESIRFPNFDRHNSKTAKDRALGALRQRESRAARHGPVTEMSRSDRDTSVTREEKRRGTEYTANAVVPEGSGTPAIDKDSRQEHRAAVLALWRELCPTLTQPRTHTPQRIRQLDGFVSKLAGDMEAVREVFEAVAGSDFLSGRGRGRDWKVDLWWVLQPRNLANIIDGKYDNARRAG